MLIDPKHYAIVRNDVPVPTRQVDGSYNDTYNYLIDVNLKSDAIKQIIKPFGFGANILSETNGFGFMMFDTLAFMALTNSKITTPDFNADEDVLSIGLYHLDDYKSCVWVHYFETNPKYRSGANNTKYKRVGTSACRAFQELYKDRGIAGRMPVGVQPFYFQNGFKHIGEYECLLGWNLQR